MTPTATSPTRTEHDLLGEREVPTDAYWGIHTLRAVENFPITGRTVGQDPHLVRALADVKQAATLANADLGVLDRTRADAIVAACREIAGGALHEQFVVDVVQGGAGTSTNMNANEVVANRALELMGRARGDYAHLHPNTHVNASQSTNDVYPTAVNIATRRWIDALVTELERLRDAFAAKAVEFHDVVKMGRTQLQDAVPMTLGQEFATYAVMLTEDVDRLRESADLLLEVNLGATAVGTGLNAPVGYAALAVAELAGITGYDLVSSPDLVEATQDVGQFVHLSGVLKRVAVKLSKVCNDLRLLSSGPRAGLGEIQLPPVQAGSSIMPGKVNPVIPEVVNQVAFQIVGNDVTISMAAEAGQLQLNAFEPVIAQRLSEGARNLAHAVAVLTDRCVVGITTDRALLRARVENSIGLATALNPRIGYEAATRIALEAAHTGASVADLVLASGLLAPDELEELLRPENLTSLPSSQENPR
ncbi:aspartate ammonia-lyase [Kineococcus aurantiacus]|uniref:Aspartate ammonia-lyase n=1 Tax=Kineococcus aurantiacus TaxID=37633 RepID=A0A7Y9DLA8_9ACTN|nr:aspartate ammonia-lyase [Kineococcus aurantiacus]